MKKISKITPVEDIEYVNKESNSTRQVPLGVFLFKYFIQVYYFIRFNFFLKEI